MPPQSEPWEDWGRDQEVGAKVPKPKPADFADVAGIIRTVLTEELDMDRFESRSFSRDLAAALMNEWDMFPRSNATHKWTTDVHNEPTNAHTDPLPDFDSILPRINPPPYTSERPHPPTPPGWMALWIILIPIAVTAATAGVVGVLSLCGVLK